MSAERQTCDVRNCTNPAVTFDLVAGFSCAKHAPADARVTA